MTKEAACRAEVEALIREIQRYLAYVQAFRDAAREPPSPAEGEKTGRDDRRGSRRR